MAVGTVSALEPNQWQLISTQSATSGTTITFSSLSGYKTYLLTFEGVACASAATIFVRFNSDSTQGKYASALNGASQDARDASIIVFPGYSATRNSGFIYINGVLQSAPKYVDGAISTADSVAGHIKGMWFDTSAITSISAISNAAYTSGSIKLYGIAG